MKAEQTTFYGLGTWISIHGPGVRAARLEIERLESILSRFTESPLTKLNRAGELHTPPPELRLSLRHALRVARATGGLVTPTVLGALERIGYLGAAARPLSPKVSDWQQVQVSREVVRLPVGVGLDLGGTGKTLIATLAARHLSGDFTLDAGGDVLLQCAQDCEMAVSHPYGQAPLTLQLPPGRWGIATSSLLTRQQVGGAHLIDPRSGASVRSAFVQVTAVTASLTRAEVLSKVAFLAPERLSALDSAAQLLAFDRQGEAHLWENGTFTRLERAA